MAKAIPVYLELGDKKAFACSIDFPGWCRCGQDRGAGPRGPGRLRPPLCRGGQAGQGRVPGPGQGRGALRGRGAGQGRRRHRLRHPPRDRRGRRPAAHLAPGGPPGRAHGGGLGDPGPGRQGLPGRAAQGPARGRPGPRQDAPPRAGGRGRLRPCARHQAPAAGRWATARPSRPSATSWPRPCAGASDGSPLRPKGWPPRYAIRRITWHVLDHAWEMQDRADPGG